MATFINANGIISPVNQESDFLNGQPFSCAATDNDFYAPGTIDISGILPGSLCELTLVGTGADTTARINTMDDKGDSGEAIPGIAPELGSTNPAQQVIYFIATGLKNYLKLTGDVSDDNASFTFSVAKLLWYKQ